MHIRHLEQFVVVAERGSLGAASRSFGLSQPAVTRNMQALEHALGSRLLIRSSSGVSLTPAGHRLLPLARSIVAFIERTDIAERRVVDDLPEVSRVGHGVWIASCHPDSVFVFFPGD